MIEKLFSQEDSYDAIVSLGEVREHPAFMKILKGDSFENLLTGVNYTSRRQDHPPIYFPYGFAYIVKSEALQRERTFYPQKSTYFIIKPDQCYEIDSLVDFRFVETLLANSEENL
jgi:CMP-N-acetylneuraminic acid synthetase